jgi:hypothetical protein
MVINSVRSTTSPTIARCRRRPVRDRDIAQIRPRNASRSGRLATTSVLFGGWWWVESEAGA